MGAARWTRRFNTRLFYRILPFLLVDFRPPVDFALSPARRTDEIAGDVAGGSADAVGFVEIAHFLANSSSFLGIIGVCLSLRGALTSSRSM